MILTKEQLLAAQPDAFKAVNRKIEEDKKREEWLKDRQGRMTSSGLHKLFTSTYNTTNSRTAESYIYERIAESLGSYIHGFRSRATDWGNQYEGPAIERFSKVTGWTVKKCMVRDGDEWVNNQEFIKWGDYCGGTPDGIVYDQPDPTATVQVKCPYNPGIHVKFLLYRNQADFKANEKEYYCQVQSEILFAKSKYPKVNKCYFMSFDPRYNENDPQGYHIIKIEEDHAFQNILKAQLENMSKTMQEKIKQIRNRKKTTAW